MAKLQWELQDVGDTRNVGQLFNSGSCRERRGASPGEELMCTESGKTVRTGLLSALELR